MSHGLVHLFYGSNCMTSEEINIEDTEDWDELLPGNTTGKMERKETQIADREADPPD
jgi:hypothetical protein